jgi:hypothetical protein
LAPLVFFVWVVEKQGKAMKESLFPLSWWLCTAREMCSLSVMNYGRIAKHSAKEAAKGAASGCVTHFLIGVAAAVLLGVHRGAHRDLPGFCANPMEKRAAAMKLLDVTKKFNTEQKYLDWI